MFVCAFWTFIYLLHIRNSHESRKILLGFMFTATCLYFGHFIVFNHIKSLIPVTDTLYSFSTLSVYPIFYIYIISLTGKVRPAHWLILVPGLVIAGVIGVCYALMTPETSDSFIRHCLYERGGCAADAAGRISVIAHIVLKYVILLQIIYVLPAGYKRLNAFKRRVGEYFSNTRHRDLREIRILLLLFVITSCLSVIADVIGRAYFVDSIARVLVVLVPFSVMLFSIGYAGFVQKFNIDDLLAEINPAAEECVPESVENEDETIQDEARIRLAEQIERLVCDEKLFLQSDLKLSDISSKLCTNRTYVYEAMKAASGTGYSSFTDYINKHRIEYAKELLQNADKDMNVENIMFECGFASKTTFYKNFKKFTGKTPKEYLNDLK